jgi:hypothetical protein
MTTTGTQLDALWALLGGDGETFDHLSMQPDVQQGNGFPVLLAAAFTLAVRQRFSSGWATRDVVQLVAQVRTRDQGRRADVNPDAAEQMLRSALTGESVGEKFDQGAKGYAQVALLAELVNDLDSRQLDALLTEARKQADRWLATTAK